MDKMKVRAKYIGAVPLLCRVYGRLAPETRADMEADGSMEAFWRYVDALPPDRRAEFEAFRRFMESPLEAPPWLSPPPPPEAIQEAARRMGWLS